MIESSTNFQQETFKQKKKDKSKIGDLTDDLQTEIPDLLQFIKKKGWREQEDRVLAQHYPHCLLADNIYTELAKVLRNTLNSQKSPAQIKKRVSKLNLQNLSEQQAIINIEKIHANKKNYHRTLKSVLDLIPLEKREIHYRAFMKVMETFMTDLSEFRGEFPNTREEFALIPTQPEEFKALFLFQALLIEMDFINPDTSKAFWRVPNYVTLDELSDRLNKFANSFGALKRSWQKQKISTQQQKHLNKKKNPINNTSQRDLESEFQELLEIEEPSYQNANEDLEEELARELLLEDDDIEFEISQKQSQNNKTSSSNYNKENNPKIENTAHQEKSNNVKIKNKNRISDSDSHSNPTIVQRKKRLKKLTRKKPSIKKKISKLTKIEEEKIESIKTETIGDNEDEKIKGLVSDSEEISVISDDFVEIRDLKPVIEQSSKDNPSESIIQKKSKTNQLNSTKPDFPKKIKNTGFKESNESKENEEIEMLLPKKRRRGLTKIRE